MMEIFTGLLLPCFYAVMACVAFCLVLNHHGKLMVVSSLGGGVGWAAYAEVMARLMKAPATGFLVVGILPFVPGGGIYYTMEYCLSGDTELFLTTGIHTFGVAGAVAVGILLVSSITRLLREGRAPKNRHLGGEK